MLILIMALFLLCWGPILTYDLLAAFELMGASNSGTAPGFVHVKTTLSLASYLNSCLNPIIYGFMSKGFRSSLRSSLCCSPGKVAGAQAALGRSRATGHSPLSLHPHQIGKQEM